VNCSAPLIGPTKQTAGCSLEPSLRLTLDLLARLIVHVDRQPVQRMPRLGAPRSAPFGAGGCFGQRGASDLNHAAPVRRAQKAHPKSVRRGSPMGIYCLAGGTHIRGALPLDPGAGKAQPEIPNCCPTSRGSKLSVMNFFIGGSANAQHRF